LGFYETLLGRAVPGQPDLFELGAFHSYSLSVSRRDNACDHVAVVFDGELFEFLYRFLGLGLLFNDQFNLSSQDAARLVDLFGPDLAGVHGRGSWHGHYAGLSRQDPDFYGPLRNALGGGRKDLMGP
jgi:hypothetical protein